jgi:hypothetical protein
MIHTALVIPAQAGIQLNKYALQRSTKTWFCALRGLFVFAGLRPAAE